MTWFRVDDSFYDHPKVVGLDMAARGLWVSAGAYCARHLTDGVITERELKVIGGTRRQAEKLVAVGLWSVGQAGEARSSGGAGRAPHYVFNDWRDFQPTRAEVTARRNEDAERKRTARAAKRAGQQQRKNVRVDTSADVPPDGSVHDRAPSSLPGPPRPDPSTSDEISSQPPHGDSAAVGLAGDPLEELAAATRRARAAGIPESAIAAGTRKFQARPDPKGPGLLRILINEAADEERLQRRCRDDLDARRNAISECARCDDRGFVETLRDGRPALVRCDHECRDTAADNRTSASG